LTPEGKNSIFQFLTAALLKILFSVDLTALNGKRHGYWKMDVNLTSAVRGNDQKGRKFLLELVEKMITYVNGYERKRENCR